MGAQETEETGQVTGTKDKDYNVIWLTEENREMPAKRLGG